MSPWGLKKSLSLFQGEDWIKRFTRCIQSNKTVFKVIVDKQSGCHFYALRELRLKNKYNKMGKAIYPMRDYFHAPDVFFCCCFFSFSVCMKSALLTEAHELWAKKKKNWMWSDWACSSWCIIHSKCGTAAVIQGGRCLCHWANDWEAHQSPSSAVMPAHGISTARWGFVRLNVSRMEGGEEVCKRFWSCGGDKTSGGQGGSGYCLKRRGATGRIINHWLLLSAVHDHVFTPSVNKAKWIVGRWIMRNFSTSLKIKAALF